MGLFQGHQALGILVSRCIIAGRSPLMVTSVHVARCRIHEPSADRNDRSGTFNAVWPRLGIIGKGGSWTGTHLANICISSGLECLDICRSESRYIE